MDPGSFMFSCKCKSHGINSSSTHIPKKLCAKMKGEEEDDEKNYPQEQDK